MKLSTLMVGAAALAMVTGTAQAGVIDMQSATGTLPFVGTITTTNNGLVAVGKGINSGAAAFGLPQPVSVMEINGSSQGNVGTLTPTRTASFTLQGSVSKDCVFYVGALNNAVLDFGTIGINASENIGPDLAFDQVAPATVTINTNVAGCNTRNTVSVGKGHAAGMTSDNGGSFDTNQFTNTLPYEVHASWTGVADGSFTPSNQTLDLTTTQQTKNTTQGAWKSPFQVLVNIPVQAKSLVSGTYTDTLAVTLAAL